MKKGTIAKTLTGIALAGSLAGAFGFGAYEGKKGNLEYLRIETAFNADRLGNNDRSISSNEYATVYSSLGLKDTGLKTEDLNVKQMERYLSENVPTNLPCSSRKAGIFNPSDSSEKRIAYDINGDGIVDGIIRTASSHSFFSAGPTFSYLEYIGEEFSPYLNQKDFGLECERKHAKVMTPEFRKAVTEMYQLALKPLPE